MSEAATLSDSDVARIADAVAERLRTIPQSPDRVAVTFSEVGAMLGAKSRSAIQRHIARLGLKPYMQGKYRLRDVEHAVARRTRT